MSAIIETWLIKTLQSNYGGMENYEKEIWMDCKEACKIFCYRAPCSCDGGCRVTLFYASL